MFRDESTVRWGPMMAAAALISLPMILLYVPRNILWEDRFYWIKVDGRELPVERPNILFYQISSVGIPIGCYGCI